MSTTLFHTMNSQQEIRSISSGYSATCALPQEHRQSAARPPPDRRKGTVRAPQEHRESAAKARATATATHTHTQPVDLFSLRCVRGASCFSVHAPAIRTPAAVPVRSVHRCSLQGARLGFPLSNPSERSHSSAQVTRSSTLLAPSKKLLETSANN